MRPTHAHAPASALGPLDGAIVSIKDLFDVAGEVTRAGSKVLAEEGKPAAADAPAVRRLRAAGAVIVAKTNMTEFAFSGHRHEPALRHPGQSADRARVPGGSSSGGAVAAADRMCEIAIGSDTGGSTRIPAALCGIVGYKPSKYRIPTDGAFPLSYTLDSIGPMARTVADCAVADAVMAGEDFARSSRRRSPGSASGGAGNAARRSRRDRDGTVRTRRSARSAGPACGCRDETVALLDEHGAGQCDGRLRAGRSLSRSIASASARRGDDVDPNVRARIERARTMPAADYVTLAQDRARLVRAMDARLADLDALVMPTTADRGAEDQRGRRRPRPSRRRISLLLRNTAIVNFFDLCAISLPLPREGGLPVGLMLVARNGHDRRLFRIAAAVEQLFAGVERASASLDSPAAASQVLVVTGV